MHSGPSKIAEAIVAVFVPPACREEILGDLHERYSSAWQYGFDALHTVPLVIISRIRRTADPQVLLMQAFAWYVSFLGAAWFQNKAVLSEQRGLLRLAIPGGIAMLGLILEDTYATPGQRSPLKLIRGPLLGLALALLSQAVVWTSNPELAIPGWIAFYGCAMSLLLSSGVRMLFLPPTDQLEGVNAPALGLKRAGGSVENSQGIVRVVKAIFVVIVIAMLGTWMADHSALPKPRVIAFLAVVLFAYRLWKRD